MQIGIDSFAAAYDDASLATSPADRLRDLVEQIEVAEQWRGPEGARGRATGFRSRCRSIRRRQ